MTSWGDVSGNVGAATDALTGVLQPESGYEMAGLIESLPELCKALHSFLAGLDGAVTERGGPLLLQTGGATADLAQHAAAMVASAEEAAAAWGEESQFWLGGG
jgi:hypothetical protein